MKSTPLAYVFWALGGFGVLGLHRLYLGRWVTAIVWFLTGGFFLVGALVDLFLIPNMVQIENLARRLLDGCQLSAVGCRPDRGEPGAS